MHGAPTYQSRPYAIHKEVRVSDRRWRESAPAGRVTTRFVKPQPSNLTRAQKIANMRKFA